MKWLLFTLRVLRIVALYLLVNLKLVVVGFTQLWLVLMVRLIALRSAWLQKAILSFFGGLYLVCLTLHVRV